MKLSIRMKEPRGDSTAFNTHMQPSQSSKSRNEESHWGTFHSQGALPVFFYAVLRLASTSRGTQRFGIVSGGQSNPSNYHAMKTCGPPPPPPIPPFLSPPPTHASATVCASLSLPCSSSISVWCWVWAAWRERGVGNASKGVGANYSIARCMCHFTADKGVTAILHLYRCCAWLTWR